MDVSSNSSLYHVMQEVILRRLKGPGSFIEVQKILPLLTASSAEHPSFHVVGLGLPGYGFSEAPKKKGFAAKQFAEVISSRPSRCVLTSG